MQNINEAEQIIENELKGVEHEVGLYDDGREMIFSIRYTDFIPREELRRRLRAKIDERYLLAISRGYSDDAVGDFFLAEYKRGRVALFDTDEAATGNFRARGIREHFFSSMEKVDLSTRR